jgi:galactoside O-acetyltransferase
VLEARGDENSGIEIGDNTIMSRNNKLSCKNGSIHLGANIGLGANTIIHAVEGNSVHIGDNVIIGAFSYIGGTRYRFERTDIPIVQQGLDLRGGVTIENNVWLGAHVSIVDGVTIGHDAIIGTGAVVTRDIPPFAIAMGVPAQVTAMRNEGQFDTLANPVMLNSQSPENQ